MTEEQQVKRVKITEEQKTAIHTIVDNLWTYVLREMPKVDAVVENIVRAIETSYDADSVEDLSLNDVVVGELEKNFYDMLDGIEQMGESQLLVVSEDDLEKLLKAHSILGYPELAKEVEKLRRKDGQSS